MKRAISLVEILVVVAIIAVLLAIVVPTVARAKGKGFETACTAQLAQLGIALSLYQVDNGGVVTPVTDNVSRALEGTGGNRVDCPLKSRVSNPNVHTSGYALNSCLDGVAFVNNPSSVFLVVEAACVNVAIAGPGPHESCIERLAVPDMDALPTVLGQPITGPIGPWGSERHLGRSNYLFVDGHVKSFLKSQLRLPGKRAKVCNYDPVLFVGPESGPRFAD